MSRITYPYMSYILICMLALAFMCTGCAEEGSQFSTIIEIDENWILRTNMAQDKAEKIAKKKDKRHLVFAPSRFVPNKMLLPLGVEYAPLPFALYRFEKD